MYLCSVPYGLLLMCSHVQESLIRISILVKVRMNLKIFQKFFTLNNITVSKFGRRYHELNIIKHMLRVKLLISIIVLHVAEACVESELNRRNEIRMHLHHKICENLINFNQSQCENLYASGFLILNWKLNVSQTFRSIEVKFQERESLDIPIILSGRLT
uniref:Uncharacterized protein n=1 Tax=Glossina pallidipes TaxID=7398 RepID=A0A1B0A1F2_GLOPL